MRPEREGGRSGGCKSAAIIAFRKGMGEKTAREERETRREGEAVAEGVMTTQRGRGGLPLVQGSRSKCIRESLTDT